MLRFQCHRLRQGSLESNCVEGNPVCFPISRQETLLFQSSGIETTEESTVFEYPKVFLYKSICFVNSISRSKEKKRNNSCIRYNQNDGVFYGLVEKIFSVANSGEAYCIVSRLSRDSTQPLCTDTITNAKLNSHLLKCTHHPITSSNIIVPIECILEKCVYMDLHQQVGNVFVSLFPNCNEPD